MYCRNKTQLVFNKIINDLIIKVYRNNEKLDNIISSISIQELNKLSSHHLLVSAITSNKIEGIEILESNSASANQLNQTFIDNYKNALDYIFNNYQNINLSLEEIKANHRTLYANTYFPFAGRWKINANNIVDARTRKIINKTISPELTDAAMGELMFWYDHDESLPDIVKDCIFIYDFLKIHPFEDGNGRTSRLLSNLLFMKDGCICLKYSSLEEQINKHVVRYYTSLRNDDIDQWFNDNVDYTYWIIFNLESIVRSQQKFIEKANLKETLMQTKNKSLKVAKWFELNINQSFTKNEIEDYLESLDVSKETIKKILPRLVENNFITKNGNTIKASFIRTFENQTKCSFEKIIPILNPGMAKQKD